MGLVPLLRALLGLYVLFTWIINNRVTRLLTSYVLSMLVFTYFAALIFYDYEIEVNPALHDFGDAICVVYRRNNGGYGIIETGEAD